MIPRILISLSCAVAIVGCQMTPEQQQQTCATAQASFAAYQAVIAASEKPSKDQIVAAAAAGAFLQAMCGWQPAKTRGARAGVVPVDANGVLILVEP